MICSILFWLHRFFSTRPFTNCFNSNGVVSLNSFISSWHSEEKGEEAEKVDSLFSFIDWTRLLTTSPEILFQLHLKLKDYWQYWDLRTSWKAFVKTKGEIYNFYINYTSSLKLGLNFIFKWCIIWSSCFNSYRIDWDLFNV